MIDPRIADALARLPDYLGSHVLVSITALALGLGVSLPLAVVAARRPALRGLLLAATSIVQTIPGLALLALFYPLLLGLAALTETTFGLGFSALGFLPSVLALALYSMLPALRNTITGLNGIDPDVREAALGVGMTPRQALIMVDLPLALPVIMAGIRTSAVWVIGTATLSTPIGQTSLGNYIFTGLQTQNWVFVLFGCFAAAILALVVDQLLALIERGVGGRDRMRVALGVSGIALLAAAALTPTLARPKANVVVGAKTFAEQYILSALISDRLRNAGFSPAQRDGLGSAVIFQALAAGDIDVYVDYSGTIWANQMKRKDIRAREDVLVQVGEWLRTRHGIAMLGSLGFENAYGLAMAREQAKALGVKSIAELATHAPRLSIAGDYEFFGRPEWIALRDAYGLQFREQRQMQAEFMYSAAAAGEVDVITAFTSDGRISQHDLIVLDDPRQAIPPYDAILLVAARKANHRKLIEALRPLVGAIDVELMRKANLRVALGGDASSPSAVSRWLAAQTRRQPPQ
jgi:osmoprotectant transport system permease protein